LNVDRHKKVLLWINILGGIAVLGGYAWGLANHPTGADALWGGVPAWLRSIFIVNMVLAALGYLAFTAYLLFVLNLETAQVNIRAGFKAFHVLYVAILIPSALWMPLTFATLAHPGNQIWLADRLVLFIVGLASLGLLSALLNIQPRRPAWFFWLAFGGGIFFAIQTALLDALVWTSYFPG
jgi:hypothetical protein